MALKATKLGKLFSKLTPYADDIARGAYNYGDDALRLASNYGDEALDYGLDVAKYADSYTDDIARGLGNPKAFGKSVPIDRTPGRNPPPALPSEYLYDDIGDIIGITNGGLNDDLTRGRALYLDAMSGGYVNAGDIPFMESTYGIDNKVANKLFPKLLRRRDTQTDFIQRFGFNPFPNESPDDLTNAIELLSIYS